MTPAETLQAIDDKFLRRLADKKRIEPLPAILAATDISFNRGQAEDKPTGYETELNREAYNVCYAVLSINHKLCSRKLM